MRQERRCIATSVYVTEEDQMLAESYADFVSQQNSKLSKARIKYKNANNAWPSNTTDLSAYGYNNAEEKQKRKAEQDKLKEAGFTFSEDGDIIAPQHHTEEVKINTKDSDEKIVESIKDTILHQCNEITLAYMRASEKTDSTKTQDGAVTDIKEKISSYITSFAKEYKLSDSVVNKLNTTVMDTAVSYAKQEYQSSMANHPRSVNNTTPYVISNSRKNELEDAVSKGQQAVRDDVSSLLSKSAKTGTCPNSTQMEGYIGEAVKRATTNNTPKDATSDDILYLQSQISKVHDEALSMYKQYAQNVKVTNTFPGNSESEDKNNKSNQKTSTQDDSKKKTSRSLAVSDYTKTNVSFSGCDMTMTAEMKTTDGTSVSVLVGELQTVSYSVYRKLSPILNIGNINAKDYVGGPRTIAGSLVFTVFNQHWGTDLMDKFAAAEGYSESQKILMDEIAPINLTVSMANEYGIAARLAIYGVRLFSEGQVMSINDIYTENTYQYVALNIDYLTNVNLNSQAKKSTEANIQQEDPKPTPVVVTPTDGSSKTTDTADTSDTTSNDPGEKEDAEAPTLNESVGKTPNSTDNTSTATPVKDVNGNTVDFSQYKNQAACEQAMNQIYQEARDKWTSEHPNATSEERIAKMNELRASYIVCLKNVKAHYQQSEE